MLRLALCFLPALAFAQSFEVASIKPSPSGLEGHDIDTSTGKNLTTSNTSLKALITFAYGLRDYQLSGGPKWLDAEHYDITARCGNCPADARIESLVQSLLADRFKLVLHREVKEGPIYSLVVARGGPKMKESGPESLGPRTQSHKTGEVTAGKLDMPHFAKYLSGRLARTVVDNTRLKGQYDFTLRWTPDTVRTEAAAESEFPSLFTALQEQLGLKLESGKGRVEILVVDSAEKPAAN